MNKNELKKIKSVIKDKCKTFKEAQTSAFREMLTVIFESLPEAKTISFTGYTPSFNDGDECKFTCKSDYPTVNGYDSNSCEWEDGEEHSSNETNEAVKLTEDVAELLSEIPEDLFGSVFGTRGFRVTITPTKIEVEDYDCGY